MSYGLALVGVVARVVHVVVAKRVPIVNCGLLHRFVCAIAKWIHVISRVVVHIHIVARVVRAISRVVHAIANVIIYAICCVLLIRIIIWNIPFKLVSEHFFILLRIIGVCFFVNLIVSFSFLPFA